MSFTSGSIKSVLKYPDGKVITLIAGVDITRGQALHITADNTVVPADGTKPVIGFAGSDASAGEALPVITYGVVVAVAGGAIAAGERVVPTSGGKVIQYVPYDVPATIADTDVEAAVAEALKVCGVALTAAGADGDPVVIKIL